MFVLLIIAYVIQKTEYHRKYSLLLLLLKSFLILLLILLLMLFFNETLDSMVTNAVLQKNEIISENKDIVKTNTPNIELPRSDEFPADKSGTSYKQLDLSRLKEFFETSKVNAVDIVEKKLKLEAIKAALETVKANAEALALHERNKLISLFEEVFRNEGHRYQQNEFPTLRKLFKYIPRDIFGLHLIPRVTWLSPAEIAAAGAAAQLALDLAEELSEAKDLVVQVTVTAAATAAAATAGQAAAAAQTAAETAQEAVQELAAQEEVQEAVQEVTEEVVVEEEVAQEVAETAQEADAQTVETEESQITKEILKLQKTQKALQETRQQLEPLNQLQEIRRAFNVKCDDLKRFVEEVKESRKASDKSKEAVRKVKEEDEKTRNEQAKAAKKSQHKKYSTTSPQQAQPPTSHGTISKDQEAVITAQQVAEHAQQNLESAAARKKQILESLENKRSEDDADLTRKKKSEYEGKQAQESARKAVEEAEKTADNINSTTAAKTAIAKKKRLTN